MSNVYRGVRVTKTESNECCKPATLIYRGVTYNKNKDKLNLNNYTLKEILNSKWFTKILPESWKDDKTCASSCRNWCTEGNDPAITRIKK